MWAHDQPEEESEGSEDEEESISDVSDSDSDSQLEIEIVTDMDDCHLTPIQMYYRLVAATDMLI